MWKSNREADGQDALAGLTRLTEDTLQALIVKAFTAKHNQIMETLSRLEENDTEAADVLRELLEELEQLRSHGSLLDVDAAAILYRASNNLAGLADTAVILTDAASGLPDTVERFHQAVQKLGNMEGNWRG